MENQEHQKETKSISDTAKKETAKKTTKSTVSKTAVKKSTSGTTKKGTAKKTTKSTASKTAVKKSTSERAKKGSAKTQKTEKPVAETSEVAKDANVVTQTINADGKDSSVVVSVPKNDNTQNGDGQMNIVINLTQEKKKEKPKKKKKKKKKPAKKKEKKQEEKRSSSLLPLLLLLLLLALLCAFIVPFCMKHTDDDSDQSQTTPLWEISADGKYMLFGSYPQRLATSEELEEINTEKADSNGYYSDTNGNKYKKLTANPYDPDTNFSNDQAIQNGTEYYFKLEKIKWRILEKENNTAFLLSESILDSHEYGENQNSDIAEWLNTSFLNTFSSAEQQIILTGENTTNKVFLIDKTTLVDKDLFDVGTTDTSEKRAKQTTDFARANNTKFVNAGTGWWLYSNDETLGYVDHSGYIYDNNNINLSTGGIAPTITINLKTKNDKTTTYTVKHYKQKLGNWKTENLTAEDCTVELEFKTSAPNKAVTPETKDFAGFTAPDTKTVVVNKNGNTVVEYFYTRKTYQLNLTANYGVKEATASGTGYEAGIAQFGATINLSAELETGYRFVNWTGYKTITTMNTSFMIDTVPTGNTISITANATGKTYKLTFDTKDETTQNPEDQEVVYDDEIGELPTPTREGYTFDGWFKDEDNEEISEDTIFDDDNFTIDHENTDQEIKLYANWTENVYSIEFDGNGATSGLLEAITSITYTHNQILPANTFTKTGFTFLGWAKTSTATSATYADEQTVSELSPTNGATVTLFAVWEAKTYTVTFDKNAEDDTISIIPPTITLLYSSEIGTLPTPTRTEFEFGGWFKESGCTTALTTSTLFNDTNFVVDHETQTATIFAKWTACIFGEAWEKDNNTHWHECESCDAKKDEASHTYADDFDTTCDICQHERTPIKANFTVEYWLQNIEDNDFTKDTEKTRSESGTTNSEISLNNYKNAITGFTFDHADQTTPTISANGNTVVKLYYSRNTYALTLVKGENVSSVSVTGTSVSGEITHTVKYGAEITLSAVVETGFVFGEWTVTDNLVTIVDNKYEHNVTSAVTITATATAKTYTVTFDKNAEDDTISFSPTTITLLYSSEIGTLPTPTRTEFEFGGWFKEFGCTTVITVSTLFNDTNFVVDHETQTATIFAKWTACVYGETWENNETEHWKICSNCNVESKHVAHTCIDGICTTCDYARKELAFSYDSDTNSYIVTGIGRVTGTEIVIPATYDDGRHGSHPVTSVDDSAFVSLYASSPSNITSVTFSNNMETIGPGAFFGCENLTTVTLSSTIKEIGNWAFSMTGLTSINIPASVETMGTNPFTYCEKLTAITVDSANTKFHVTNNCLIDTVNKKLIIGLNYNNIPSNSEEVTTIGYAAFAKMSGGTTLKIPSNITTLDDGAFSDCTNIVSVELPNEIGISNAAFDVCTSLTTIYYAGTQAEWSENVSYNSSYNTAFVNATRYYYSETEPMAVGKYWHYVEGVATPWAEKMTYKVEHYVENENGGYNTPESIENLVGTIGGEVTATPKTYAYYTHDTENDDRVESGTVTSDGNLVLRVYYTRNSYTLTLIKGTGIASVSIAGSSDVTTLSDGEYSIKHGEAVRLIATAESGYTFSSWTGHSSINSSNVFTMPTENVTITANAIGKEYDLTFSGNATDDTTTITPESKEVTYGSAIGDLATATRTGFTFAGWFKETGYTNQISTTTTVNDTNFAVNHTAQTITIYAKWNEHHYTIAFNGNGGTGEMASLTNVAYSENKTLTANTFEKEGYTFVGWATDEDATTAIYTNGQSVSKLKAENGATVTLYAVWTADTNTGYTVKHYKQKLGNWKTTGLTAEDCEDEYATTTGAGETDTQVTPSTKSYDGFTAPSTQTVTIAGDGSTVVEYFYLRNSYNLTFVNGTGIDSITASGTGYNSEENKAQFGAYITLNKTVSAGYTFGAYSSSDVTISNGTFTMPAKAVTITATATAKIYDLSYTLQLSSEQQDESATVSPSSKNVEYNTAIGELPTPTRDGYTFAGWYKEGTFETEITSETILNDSNVQLTHLASLANIYAKWTPNTNTAYSIEYYLQNLAGNDYIKDTTKTVNTTGTTGAEIDLNTYKTAIAGFEFDHSDPTTNATINGNGNTVVKLYYTRKSFTLTLTKGANVDTISATGTYVTANTDNYTVKYGASVTLSATANAGYTVSSWTGYTVTDNSFTMPAENVTLTANATANTNTAYKVEHYQEELAGGTYTLADTDNLTGTTGATVTATAKTDYDYFTHDTTNTNRVESGTITGDGTLTLKVYYKRKTGTLLIGKETGIDTVSASGTGVTATTGTATYTRYSVKYGAEVTLTATASTGYTLTGWEKGSVILSGNTYTHNALEIMVTAKATANSYSLTYDTNGGGTITAVTKTYNTAFTSAELPTNLTKTGYTFVGWFNDSSFTTEVETNDLFTTSNAAFTNVATASTTATIYAKWTENTYTISFNGNGGAGEMASLTNVAYSENKTLTANTFEKEGYTFVGWSTSSTSTTVAYANKQQVSKLVSTNGGTLTLYALWNPKKNTAYSIEYYLQNLADNDYTKDTTRTVSATGTTDTSIDIDSYEVSIAGYTFDHSDPTSATIAGSGNITIKLYYTRNSYTLTLNTCTGVSTVSASGTGVTSETSGYSVKFGANVTLSATTSDAYTFDVWTEANNKVQISGNTYSHNVAENLTITPNAIETTSLYVVTFNLNVDDATTITLPQTTKNATNGEAIGTLPTPTSTDYQFLGWFKESGCTNQITATTILNEINFALNLTEHTTTIYAKFVACSFGTTWTTNETAHWHECSACGNKKDYAEHTFLSGVCSVCEYEREELEFDYRQNIYGDYSYAYFVTGIGRITSSDVVIPESYDDGEHGEKPVVGISYNAFKDNKNITSVTMPTSVIYVGDDAFLNCTNLTAVYISDLSAWLKANFMNASNPLCYAHDLYLNGTKLTSITIPNDVTEIGRAALNGASITSITIPNHVTEIGEKAFSSSNITEVIIPSSLTEIDSVVFYDCKSLTTVTIPSTIKKIKLQAFSTCPELTTINISDLSAFLNIEFRDVEANPIHNTKANLYLNGEKITDLVVPSDVTAIKKYAMYNYRQLTSVTIHSGVTSIGESAFEKCSALGSITFETGSELTTIGKSAFAYTAITSISIPCGVTSIANRLFYSCSNLENVTFEGDVTTLGQEIFDHCLDLLTIVIPATVTKVSTTNNKETFSGYTSPLIVIFFEGTQEQWDALGVTTVTGTRTVCIYSETEPTSSTGHYWHYVNGTPTLWN